MKKKMFIYPVEPWTITETDFDVSNNFRNETVFALSNGYIGTRGTFIEGDDFDVDTGLEGNFINGFYESEPVRYGEWNYGFPTMSQSLLNLPDCKRIEIYLGSERLDLRKGITENYSRTLHMDKGIVTRSFVWQSPDGKRVRYASEHIVCLNRKNLMAIRLYLTPLNFSGTILLKSILNADVQNHTRQTNPLVDYGPFGRSIDPDIIESQANSVLYMGTTHNSHLSMACGAAHELLPCVSAKFETNKLTASVSYSHNVRQNEKVMLVKYIGYTSSLDMPKNELLSFVKETLNEAQTLGYDALLYEQRKTMSDFWAGADVKIEGDDAIQQGIRFNLFHVMQAAGRDGKTGMGAKGLSGEGYEGHYFWDTEMYVLPVFVWTNPVLAKNLLLFRYYTLDKARARARVLGHEKGALYPWRTINGEEASTYFPLGTAQYHINADIAYAVWLYYMATDDIDFLRDFGAEMLVETARVFADVGCFAECRNGQYCICAVTGPDEYNAIVDNNFYTNLMARENLYSALKAIDVLGGQVSAVSNRLGISEDELASWKRIADNMYLPYDQKLGVYLQDDGYMMRKPYDENSVPAEKRHLLYENYHPLFIYRQRMSKQADAIMALELLSGYFTDDELRRNYDFYQTVTLHHSSLSTCIFGILASRIGNEDDAFRYFSESARMDIDDYHENFYSGIHAANMAGSWLLIVNGFAGLRIKDGVAEFSPVLPETMEGYEFSICYRGAKIHIKIKRNSACFVLKNDVSISFMVRGQSITLNKQGETYYEEI